MLNRRRAGAKSNRINARSSMRVQAPFPGADDTALAIHGLVPAGCQSVGEKNFNTYGDNQGGSPLPVTQTSPFHHHLLLVKRPALVILFFVRFFGAHSPPG